LHGEPCDPLSPRGRFVFAKVPTGFGLLGEELRRFYDGGGMSEGACLELSLVARTRG